jgi:hypothetical protein
MSNALGVMQKNGKFVVTKNGEPMLLPKSDGQPIVTEFTTKEDAEKYMSIVAHLQKKKGYKK